jgi:hypothetical protein
MIYLGIRARSAPQALRIDFLLDIKPFKLKLSFWFFHVVFAAFNVYISLIVVNINKLLAQRHHHAAPA